MVAGYEVRDMQDKTSYYYANGQPVPLTPEPGQFALRFNRSRSALSPEAMAILRSRVEPIVDIPHRQIKLFRTDDAERAVTVLGREEPVNFATPVFRQSPHNPDPLIITREFVAQFKPDVTRVQVDELNARHNVRIVRELEYASNGYLLEAPRGDSGCMPSCSRTSITSPGWSCSRIRIS